MQKIKGQPIRETIGVLSHLKEKGLVFTDYKMVAYTREGNKVEVSYNAKEDKRFQ